MSHAYGRACDRHHVVIDAITCPEGCGSHGVVYEPCSPDCPEWVTPCGTDTGEA